MQAFLEMQRTALQPVQRAGVSLPLNKMPASLEACHPRYSGALATQEPAPAEGGFQAAFLEVKGASPRQE